MTQDSRQSGQSVIEFLLSSGLLILVLAGSGWLLKLHWERSKCAYLVFEKTHARLNGVQRPTLASDLTVAISESPTGVTGESLCAPGALPELIRLKKLQPELW